MLGKMSGFIDCHCHLASTDFKEDIHEVISRAKKTGVRCALVVPDLKYELPLVCDLAKTYPDFIAPALGIHPVQGSSPDNLRSVSWDDFEGVTELITEYKENIVAIGEIGLDFTPRFIKSDSDKQTQRDIFKKQIQLAKSLNLPVNVHSRSAGRPAIELLKSEGAEMVLLHAFDGRPSIAMQGVQAGYYFSIPPSIVRSEQQKLVKQLPLEKLCLETDSPALAAEKQTRNEPCNITICCDYIAKVKNITPEEVQRVTTANALKLFPKLDKFFDV
ncbi:putative deoxyribonuclease TATDN3 isoform X2 [Apostichopus japonicus]|uniref:putative deoxyribonuclease TATDN3 isoform X2 n=1 Tax=Stichopus japonicus TaxID=307972 RepID=UPI003AB54323